MLLSWTTPIDNDLFFGYPSMLILRKKGLIFSLGSFFILSQTTPMDDDSFFGYPSMFILRKIYSIKYDRARIMVFDGRTNS